MVRDAQLETLYRVDRELKRQIEKWGVQRHDAAKWLVILVEEVGEVAKEIYESSEMTPAGLKALTDELVQVAAVAVSAVESIEYQYQR